MVKFLQFLGISKIEPNVIELCFSQFPYMAYELIGVVESNIVLWVFDLSAIEGAKEERERA